jgi:hypothetical protein
MGGRTRRTVEGARELLRAERADETADR